MQGEIKAGEDGLRQLLSLLQPNINDLQNIFNQLMQVEAGVSSSVMERACAEADLASLKNITSMASDALASNCRAISQCIDAFNSTDAALASQMGVVGYLAAVVAGGPAGMAAYGVLSQLIHSGAIDLNNIYGLLSSSNMSYTDMETLKLHLLQYENSKINGETDSSLLLAGFSEGGSVALMHAEGQLKGTYGEMSGSVSLLSAEASAKAGVYYENGNMVVGAEVGASVCAFKAEGFIGTPSDAPAQLYAKGNVKVLEASAGASAKLSLKEGGVKAEIGATLASVEGTLGGRLGPVEASATGELKIGIGAQADIGWKDGKLHCELGAALGIGVSLKFDIGLSEDAVKAVSDFASSAASNIGNTVNSITNVFSSFMDNGSKLLGGAGNFNLPFL